MIACELIFVPPPETKVIKRIHASRHFFLRVLQHCFLSSVVPKGTGAAGPEASHLPLKVSEVWQGMIKTWEELSSCVVKWSGNFLEIANYKESESKSEVKPRIRVALAVHVTATHNNLISRSCSRQQEYKRSHRDDNYPRKTIQTVEEVGKEPGKCWKGIRYERTPRLEVAGWIDSSGGLKRKWINGDMQCSEWI